MEKQSLSNDVKERYLDATLAAFMEEYVSVMDTGAEQSNGEFPQELDARCRKIIENARKQRRRNQMLRSFMRICRSAAVLLVVLMCVGTTLFFTVESFRLPVMNLIFERMENYTQISSKHTTVMSKTVGMDVDLNDPLKLALEVLDFENSIMRTLSVTLPSVFLQLISSLLAGYGFARFRFRGKMCFSHC
jgi:ABC-type glycerol-3-phosphate transport system permease component